jgi:hypothetical protein
MEASVVRNTIFLGQDPMEIISRARALSDDIEHILAEGGLSQHHLDAAPILDHWGIVARARPVLAGVTTGHPVLGDHRAIFTSDLFALDADAGWARTASRFYRLGHPVGAAHGRDQ